MGGKNVIGESRSQNARWLIRAAVAAALSTSFSMSAMGQEAAALCCDLPAAEREPVLQEASVTGSRIVRRDIQRTSPMVTVEREILERSSYISIEQALNELPELMAGGPLAGGSAVTSLSAAGDAAGGSRLAATCSTPRAPSITRASAPTRRAPPR